MTNQVKNYYELLELSPGANQETIERMVRYLATKLHPDAGGDKDRFNELMQAYETLRNPALRASYDLQLASQQQHDTELVEHAKQAGPDTVDRHQLMRLFYAARRQNPKRPGLGLVTVENQMNCPAEILEFHLWYFREKGWIKREDGGGFSITADGVDHIESREIEFATNLRLNAPQTSNAPGISVAS